MTREKDKSYKGIPYLTFDNHKKALSGLSQPVKVA
jgi:hypothetical protein